MSWFNSARRGVFGFCFAAALLALLPAQSMAIPVLQLYVEGGMYDDATQTWTLSSLDPSIRLWTIGNISGSEGKGSIYNVRLAAAYSSAAGSPTITLTPSTVDDDEYVGFTDPSTPAVPALLQEVTDGSAPKLGDGTGLPAHDLPPHGIYGAGTWWQEFSLGDFTLTDSPIGDFIAGFPEPSGTAQGQINVYDVAISSATENEVLVHFDLYDHVEGGTHVSYKFAPFSHDAEGTIENPGGSPNPEVPEPASLVVWLVLGLAACGWGWRRRVARG